MGVRLLRETLRDLAAGVVVKEPQNEANATWEPIRERPPIGRPDLPRLPAPGRLSEPFQTRLKRR